MIGRIYRALRKPPLSKHQFSVRKLMFTPYREKKKRHESQILYQYRKKSILTRQIWTREVTTRVFQSVSHIELGAILFFFGLINGISPKKKNDHKFYMTDTSACMTYRKKYSVDDLKKKNSIIFR